MSIGLAATMMHEAVYYESLVTTPVTTNTATTTLAPSNGTAPITEIPYSATAAITTEAEEKKSSVEPAADVPEKGPSHEGEVTDLIPPSTRALDSPVGSGRGKAESLVTGDTPTLTFPTEHLETDVQPTNGTAGEVNEVGPRTPANSPSLKQAALTLALSSSTPTAPTTTPAPTTTTTAPPLDYNKLSLELKQMAFTTAQGIHDAGWVDFGYQFATPEVSVYTSYIYTLHVIV